MYRGGLFPLPPLLTDALSRMTPAAFSRNDLTLPSSESVFHLETFSSHLRFLRGALFMKDVEAKPLVLAVRSLTYWVLRMSERNGGDFGLR